MKDRTSLDQINIRSDEAYERAHRLARQCNISVTTVVEQALAKLEEAALQTSSRLTPEQIAENKRKLDAAREAMWGADGPPQGLSSDHSWLYDEHGLPK